MTSRTICLATPNQSENIFRLYSETFSEPSWSASDFTNAIVAPTHHVFLANTPMPAGFAVLSCAADEGEILTIGVIPKQRKSGIADALLHALEQTAATQHIKNIFLEVAEDNRAAKNLYTKRGYQQVGLRPQYYASGANALIMSKTI